MPTAKLVSSVLTLVICGLGIVGNLLCGVVLSHKDMTSSYVYNLIGLTFSDILLLVLSATRTVNNIHVYLHAGPIVDPLLFIWDWICTSGTKYYTVAISVERFFVVTYPLKAHAYVTPERSKWFSLGVLGFVIGLSLTSYAYNFHIDAYSFNVYAVVVLHFLPFALVLVFNVLICVGLRKSKKEVASLTAAQASENSVTRMLFAVVTIFGVCYSFEIIRRLMNYFWPAYMTAHDHYDYAINFLADIFYVLNSSVNFVIYCLLGKKFRSVFLKVFSACFCKFSKSSSCDDDDDVGDNNSDEPVVCKRMSYRTQSNSM